MPDREKFFIAGKNLESFTLLFVCVVFIAVESVSFQKTIDSFNIRKITIRCCQTRVMLAEAPI